MLDDKKILLRARKMIVSNWFDVRQLRVRVIRGSINVHGHVYRLTGTDDEREGDESSLRRLDADLRSIPSCRSVLYELDNWSFDLSGGWRRLLQKQITPVPTKPSPATPEPQAPEISSE